jgi:hypothetical protein
VTGLGEVLPTDALAWYSQVLSHGDQSIANGTDDYWTHLCRAEALVATGNGAEAGCALLTAVESGAPIEDLRSETEQLSFFLDIDFAASSAATALAAVESTAKQ